MLHRHSRFLITAEKVFCGIFEQISGNHYRLDNLSTISTKKTERCLYKSKKDFGDNPKNNLKHNHALIYAAYRNKQRGQVKNYLFHARFFGKVSGTNG